MQQDTGIVSQVTSIHHASWGRDILAVEYSRANSTFADKTKRDVAENLSLPSAHALADPGPGPATLGACPGSRTAAVRGQPLR
uniref:Uncharacterized protein n=1 Tax=Arundo donax TaxID=35708 RepID=A0A0A9FEA5_ARUDO